MAVAYVILNGELRGSPDFYRKRLAETPGDVFCADGGARHAESLGITPLALYGDFDSADPALLSRYAGQGVEIHRFPVRKDKTDGEILLEALADRHYEKIFILAGTGGRSDHFLMNLQLAFRFEGLVFLAEGEEMFAVKSGAVLEGCLGATVSFLAVGGPVRGLFLEGFRYPLTDAVLWPGSSLCVSNVATAEKCFVKFESGQLFCVVSTKALDFS